MTDLQQNLIDQIAAFTQAQGVGPSLDEVARAFRCRPDGALLRSLEALAEHGHLKQENARWRIVSGQEQMHFELMSAPAPAGLPPR